MKTEWISVNSKKKPNDDEVVLVFCPNWSAEGYDLATHESFDNSWSNGSNQEMTEFVTHWMILPKPPKALQSKKLK